MTALMSVVIQTILLSCSTAGFAGAGISAAVRRHKDMQNLPDDDGFAAIATILFMAGMLCADLAGGLSAIAAIVVPVGLASYALTAQRLGMFRIETGRIPLGTPRETELHT